MTGDFTLEGSCGKARAGRLRLPHGEVPTPVFMPVGTQGTVKAMTVQAVEDAGSRIILANTYHLFLRPGLEVLEHFNGLHEFMNWSGQNTAPGNGISDIPRIIISKKY